MRAVHYSLLSWGGPLWQNAREIATTGSTKRNERLEETCYNFSVILGNLDSSFEVVDASNQQLSVEESALRSLAIRCKDTSTELSAILEKLRVNQQASTHTKNLRKSFRSLWESRKINDLASRLSEYRSELVANLSALTSNRQSTVLRELATLQERNASMQLRQTAKLEEVSRTVQQIHQVSERLHENALSPTTEKLDQLAYDIKQVEYTGLADTLNNSISAIRELSIQQTILRSLHFESRAIADAQYETFNWILRPAKPKFDQDQSQGGGDFSTFVEWLRHRNGVFWISGKPGSGKSTLMKFLSQHPDTTKILSDWASSNDCITAHHYFYIAGTHLQKSCEGLLRAFLFEVLLKRPALMKATVPERYQNATRKSIKLFNEFQPWAMPELLQSLHDPPQITCLGILDSSSAHLFYSSTGSTQSTFVAFTITYSPFVIGSGEICFFVDGLDEYESNSQEVIRVLDQLASSPNIKMCIASRPWNVFEDAYGRNKADRIYLQDLTQRDIRIYTTRMLQEHPKWTLFSRQNNSHEDLITAITSRAQGVFLWVYLVVRSLYDGLSDGNDLKTLKRRIEAFPRDLEGFFMHMIESIDPFYHREMSQCFQTAIHSDEPLPLMLYELLGQVIEDLDFALNLLKISQMSAREMFERHDDMVRRLNSWCKGLLEVQRDNSGRYYLGHRVVFLHRTMSDFFRTNQMEQYLQQRIDYLSQNSGFQWGNAYIALIKSMPLIKGDRQDEKAFHAGVQEAFCYAALTETDHEQCDPVLVNELRYTVEEIAPLYDFAPPWNSFLEQCIKFGLHRYLSQHPDCQASSLGIIDGSLLRRSLSHGVQPESSTTNRSKDVVTLFLQRQKEGNPRILDSASPEVSIWVLWMESVGKTMDENGTKSRWAARQQHILHSLLKFGVNVKVKEAADAVLGKFIMALVSLSQQEPDRSITDLWMAMLNTIILAGADLNAGFKGTTVGEHFFEEVSELCNPSWTHVPEARMRFLARIAHIVIEHGAISTEVASQENLERLFPQKLSKPILETHHPKPAQTEQTGYFSSLNSVGTWCRSMVTMGQW
ncbi:hypothetical protein G7054_g6266 [Neopestalotiopsis clavispora]|nr:hypothetical protein G7054_g6266 [Neopestalotiopsis clavispora]